MIHNLLPEDLRRSLIMTGRSLNRTDLFWLLGGSCGLFFQGVNLNKDPRDIDVYTDIDAVSALHHELAQWAEDAPHIDEEGIYKSVLSHYEIDGYTTELVGGFRVTSQESVYQVKIKDLLYAYAPEVSLDDISFRLMPLSHELVFNILRNRSERYEAIAEVIRQQPESHEELLRKIVSQTQWNRSHLSLIKQLTTISL